MAKVILVYARCNDPKAKGDYTLAGGIASDLVVEIAKHSLDLEVVLTSNLDGIPHFEQLYGKPINGKVTVDGNIVGLCSLESFNANTNKVVAFIDANHCKYAPAEIVKNVISADTKFLFINAANSQTFSGHFEKLLFMVQYPYTRQPDLHAHFSLDDIMIGTCGLGGDRLGFQSVKPVRELPALSDEGKRKIPFGSYGFIYLSARPDLQPTAIKIFAQTMYLTELNQYVVVGDFVGHADAIEKEYQSTLTINGMLPSKNMPVCFFQGSLQQILMRNMIVQSSGSVVASTGIMSTIEAMRDGKLTFYQDLDNNEGFVKNYLDSMNDFCRHSISSTIAIQRMMIELTILLFKSKPLNNADLNRTKQLLSMRPLTSSLVKANEAIIAKASGKLAPQLLTFITRANRTRLQDQVDSVRRSLRKDPFELPPAIDVAFRRAAAWGKLFELKVLLQVMSPAQIDAADPKHNRTALHWACKEGKKECAQLLIEHGAKVDAKDKNQRTPSECAADNNHYSVVQVFLDCQTQSLMTSPSMSFR